MQNDTDQNLSTAGQKIPVALSIAGSDSSGGAGIQADLKTFCAFRVYGTTAITALTAQNTRGVQAVQPVAASFVSAQIDSILSDLDVRAAKTGMLANAAIIGAVVSALAKFPGLPLVADPVMVATSGDPLLDPEAVDAVRTRLLPRSLLITPNLSEASVLLGTATAATWPEMEAQGRALLAFGPGAVLMKGGHFDADIARDVLVSRDAVEWFEAPRIATGNTHGTGCTLSAAIAAGLAMGASLPNAVGRAKAYLTAALEAGRHHGIGHGHGPVNHFVVPASIP